MLAGIAIACALSCAVASVAFAQAPNEAAVGDAEDAQPGYVATRVAGERPVGFAVRGTSGYGLTESVTGAPGPHHRSTFGLAASGNPLPWLGIALRLDGRADFHPNDGMGKDRGFVGTGAFALRASSSLRNGLAMGAQVTLLAYGGNAPSFDWGSLSAEASALVAYRRGGFSLATELGYRVDRSARSVPSGALYRPGDRLSLGVSDYDAVLLRLGAGYRHEALEGFGEVRWDVLVGGAPVSESPLHLAVGGRLHPSDAWQLELVLDACLSQRPTVDNAAPHIPIDPRFAARFAVVYRFGRAAAPVRETTPPDLGDGGGTPDAGGGATPPEATRSFEGAVQDEAGAPLVDAHVVVHVGEWQGDAYSDGQGRFRIDGIPEGDAHVEIVAVGHTPVEVQLGSGELALPDGGVRLVRAEPTGVIRGLVRDFEGQGVRASIRVAPGGHTARADEQGQFELELPPGTYTVTVEAPGFQTQSRDVHLSDGQVTIYNVDLRRGR